MAVACSASVYDFGHASSRDSASTETRMNAAPSGIHISRYCQQVSAERNSFAASYQQTVTCHERVRTPW